MIVNFLAGLSTTKEPVVSENIVCLIGLVALFGMIAVAVYLFIIYGMKMKDYEFLNTEIIETEYGVSGMVKEKKKEYAPKFTSNIALGVVLCIVSVIPLISVVLLEMSEVIIISMVCVLLAIVSCGVTLLFTAGVINSSFDKILQENEYSKTSKNQTNHTKLLVRHTGLSQQQFILDGASLVGVGEELG